MPEQYVVPEGTQENRWRMSILISVFPAYSLIFMTQQAPSQQDTPRNLLN
jgi:hypothetical protein